MAGTKAKRGIGAKAKEYGGKYKNDIQEAYNAGYNAGWNDGMNIPNRVGAVTSAMAGYGKGAKQRQKTEKYTANYNRRRR